MVAEGTLALLAGDVLLLRVRLVLYPVVAVHVPGLGGAVLAGLGCLAALGQFVLSFDVLA